MKKNYIFFEKSGIMKNWVIMYVRKIFENQFESRL